MLEFGRTTRAWMDADPENVIAVHCKGGKGRTGTIICVWLIESGNFEKAQVSSTKALLALFFILLMSSSKLGSD